MNPFKLSLTYCGKYILLYILIIILISMISIQICGAKESSFSWVPNTDNTVGYKICWGTKEGEYLNCIDIKGGTEVDGRLVATVDLPNTSVYVAATAYDGYGNESDYSSSIYIKAINPEQPKQLQKVVITVDSNGVITVTYEDGTTVTVQ